MKKLLLFVSIGSLLSNQSLNAQNVVTLGYNGVNAKVGVSGQLFNGNYTNPGFEYPKGSGKHLMWTMNDWYAGVDVNSQLKMAASEGQLNAPYAAGDFYPGPLTVSPGSNGPNNLEFGEAITDANTMNLYYKVWVITKAEIDSAVEYITTSPNWPGYVVPNVMYNWPAHGDVSQGYAYNLAPYVDADLNGYYDPAGGDYPDIKGDFCAYTIYNDRGGLHLTSGADPIGLEIHQMVYGYISNPECDYHEALDATLFVYRRIINRGTQTLFNFSMGIFADPDIGNSGDDFIGCDVDRSMMYAYNGDTYDEGATGYGNDIPAIGIVILEGINQDLNGNDDMVGIGTNESINGFGFGNGVADDEKLGLTGFTYLLGVAGLTSLNSAADRNNLINGNFTNGSPFMDPDGTTKFMYPDNSNPQGYLQGGVVYAPWEELGNGNTPGDKKMLAVSGDNTLTPGEYYDVTIAVVAGPTTQSGIGSILALQNRVDSIRNVYSSTLDLCADAGLGEPSVENIFLYPNPASTILNIEGITAQTKISVHDSFGRLVMQASGMTALNIEHLNSGVYFVLLEDSIGLVTKRFIK